jgi:hypothetical protein
MVDNFMSDNCYFQNLFCKPLSGPALPSLYLSLICLCPDLLLLGLDLSLQYLSQAAIRRALPLLWMVPSLEKVSPRFLRLQLTSLVRQGSTVYFCLKL